MLRPNHLRLLLRQFVPDDDVAGVRQEVEFAITVDVDQLAGLQVYRSVDLVLDPGLPAIAAGIRIEVITG